MPRLQPLGRRLADSSWGHVNKHLLTANSLQSCLTLFDPIDGSPPGSTVPGILQARTLEWVAISFSNAWKWKVKVKSLSRIRPSGTPWTAAYQAPPSMGFSRQEYWSGVPLPSPGGEWIHVICITESLCCTLKTITVLLITYTQYKIKSQKTNKPKLRSKRNPKKH